MIGRVIAILCLSVVGLVGLGMSLCGGVFTFSALLDWGSRSGGELHPRDFLVIALPSLVIGVAIVIGVVKVIKRLQRRPAPAGGADEH